MSSSAPPPHLRAAASSLSSLAAPPTKLSVMEETASLALSVVLLLLVLDLDLSVPGLEFLKMELEKIFLTGVAPLVHLEAKGNLIFLETFVVAVLTATQADVEPFLDKPVPLQTSKYAGLLHNKGA